MGKQSGYNSLTDLIKEFEKNAICADSKKDSAAKLAPDTYGGAIFYLYISNNAEPENRNIKHHRNSKARGFITGIKNYIKSVNTGIEKTNVLQKIRDITSKKPQALAYGIERKKSPYVKGIISVTYDILRKGKELKDIGEAIKSVKREDNMLKQREYWNTYYTLEKLLKNDKK